MSMLHTAEMSAPLRRIVIVISFLPAWYVGTQDSTIVSVGLFQFTYCYPMPVSASVRLAPYFPALSCTRWQHADAGTAYQYMLIAGSTGEWQLAVAVSFMIRSEAH